MWGIKLKDLKQELYNNYGIKEIALFGCYARDEVDENSDIIAIISIIKGAGGFLVAKAKRYLREMLNKNIEIGFYSAMNSYIRKNIEKEIVDV